MEKYKKEMDKKRKEISKVQENIESLENSDGAQRDIDKLKGKLRTLEAEHIKARKKYFDNYKPERDEQNSEENVEIMEYLQEEDLINQEIDNTSETLKAIKKRKEALDWRKQIELDKSLDPDATDKERQEAIKKLTQLDQSYQMIVAEEKMFQKKLGVKRSLQKKEIEKLQQRKEELEKANKEDMNIINDEDADPDKKTNAEERVAIRRKEIGQIIAQLEENMSLREKIKEIFKKYGVMVVSIFLAAGITIGAVVGTITNALKTMGKQLANGLKTIGAKAAAALPGLISSIVSFLFKAAGQAIGFLAKHTWLLILAAVAFLVGKLRRR